MFGFVIRIYCGGLQRGRVGNQNHKIGFKFEPAGMDGTGRLVMPYVARTIVE